MRTARRRRVLLGAIVIVALTSTTLHAEQAGIRAFVDPETGELVPGPPVDGAAALAAPSVTAPVDLVEESVPQPGGGVRVRLGSRFHMNRHVHVDQDGVLHERCVPGAP